VTVHGFPGESELARRMREFDWAATPVGAPSTWPRNLRVALDICLSSRFPMHVWWGPELTLFYNDAYIPFLGRKHPHALGRSGRDAWTEIWHQIGPMIDRVFATGEASWSEDIQMFFAREVPREEVYVTFSFSPIRGHDGRVDGMFCACTETTDKIIGNRRLDVLRELGVSATTAHSVADAIAASAAVLARNAPALPFIAIYQGDDTAIELREAVGIDRQRLPARVTAGESDRWGLAEALRARHAVPISITDERLAFGPWSDVIERALAVPLRLQDGTAVFLAGVSPRRPFDAGYRSFIERVAGHIATAIVDARHHELERARAESLAELDRAKTAFFANVSHEFRTPLTLLLGPVEQLLATADGARRDQLELVHRNAVRLQKLVNTLLDYARAEAGRARAVFMAHDLAQLTTDLASTFRSAIEAAGLTFTVACDALDSPVWVDREMWEKIVFNLLSNAFKYTFDGTIAVSLRHANDGVRLEVSDTGVGIAEAELAHVFERFHRIEGQRARSFEGSGIGLALVQNLVGLHDGTIDVTSAVGRGTTFSVELPLRALGTNTVETAGGSTVSRAFLHELASWASAVSQPVGRDAAPRILVADDNADMRAYVTGLLAAEFSITAVADGESALAHAFAQPPDLVIADVMMPVMDGFELVRRLRDDARTRHVPIVVLSARTDEEARIDGLEAGADDYLVKPFSPRELQARVRVNLELAHARLRAGEVSAELRARNDLIALLGHELRNPLAPIATTLQTIAMTGRADAESIAIMQRQVSHMNQLINDLLDISRLAHGKLELHLGLIDLASVATGALDRIAPLLEPQNHDVELQLRRGILVRGDGDRLVQALAALVSNAVRFSPRGAPIVVAVSRIGERGRIEVRDRGEGMTSQQLARAFEPFTQEQQPLDRTKGGLGIGLSLARGIVEAHGGTVVGRSAGLGRGSAFTIELPLATVTAQPRADRDPAKLRVLVVDDNRDAANALGAGLDYAVAIAYDASEALRVEQTFDPEVAIVDIDLPEVDGYQLATQLRELRAIRVITVSGYPREPDPARARRIGIAAHLIKPLDLRTVARAVTSP
jgi:signal transduction histidine kinase